MRKSSRYLNLFKCSAIFMLLLVFSSVQAQDSKQVEIPAMGFFVTSVGLGDGASLGGLEGADAHCQALAGANGGDQRIWRAYLSTQAIGDRKAVNARDRIGTGPWYNAKGDLIGANIDDLHYNNSNIKYEMALDEAGKTINSRAMGDSPSKHDILTGSQLDGTAFAAGKDMTCGNFTHNGEGSAMLGHSDRFRRTTPGSPWNAAHPSRGCSQENLEATGGAGLFYCFAIEE
jgi:hypothetical protein